MKHFLKRFVIRWGVTTLGLWIAAALLGPDRLSLGHSWQTTLIAGLLLALVNMALKPLIVLLSLPAILFTLGLFILVVNGALILIASFLYDPFYVKNLWTAILAGIIVGFVNFLVTRILEDIR